MNNRLFTIVFFLQQSWKREVAEHNERMKGEEVNIPIAADHDVLIRRRKEELKHAQDVKELYERKLEKVNDLYMELSAWKLQLEETERNLARRERQISIHGSKVHYKKKLRPFSTSGKTPDRFQPRPSRSLSTTRARKSSPSTPEVLSTSPEAPFNIPPPHMLFGGGSTSLTNVAPSYVHNDPIVVRENPGFGCTNDFSRTSTNHTTATATGFCTNLNELTSSQVGGATGIDWAKVTRLGKARASDVLDPFEVESLPKAVVRMRPKNLPREARVRAPTKKASPCRLVEPSE